MRKPLTHAELTNLYSELDELEGIPIPEQTAQTIQRGKDIHRILDKDAHLVIFLERGIKVLEGGKREVA